MVVLLHALAKTKTTKGGVKTPSEVTGIVPYIAGPMQEDT